MSHFPDIYTAQQGVSMTNNYHQRTVRRSVGIWNNVVLVVLFFVTGTSAGAADSSTENFSTDVQPILKQHCYSCHGPDKQKADLRLDTADPDMLNGKDGETWHEVMHQIQRGEMPPEDKPQLSSAERNAVINWVQSSITRAAQSRVASRQTLRRLTREEYANTMRDLIGIDMDYAETLQQESASHGGFTNNGASLGFSAMQLESLLETARKALREAIVEGPQPKVFSHSSAGNDSGGGKKKKKDQPATTTGETLYYHCGVFMTSTKEKDYPRQGDVKVTAKLNVVVPKGAEKVHIRASVGFDAGSGSIVLTPLGDYVIAESGEKELTWTGRMERMPLPEPGNPRAHLTLFIVHLPDDGSELLFKNGAGGKGLTIIDDDHPRGFNKNTNPRDPQKYSHFIVKEATFVAPVITTWPPPAHRRILFERPSQMSDEQYANAVIKKFTERAFRRPVSESDIEPYIGYYKDVLKQTKSDIAAMRESLAAVLVAPEFLYLVQPAAENSKPRPLTSLEIASRLSYFIWGTMPDETLMAAAQGNKLINTSELTGQAKRLLGHDKSKFFAQSFVDQWLGLATADNIAVAPEYYPDFKDALKPFIKEETRLLFYDTLYNNLSLMNLISANYSFLNEPLAKHYGITGPRGASFQRVTFKPTDKRRGILTHASTLLAGSNGVDSHPILRAVWVRERLLHDPPLPPPPNVTLDDKIEKTEGLSLLQKLEIHRKNEACYDCHKNLDPWGVPFEHYDAVGQWREQVRLLVEKEAPSEKKKNQKETHEYTLVKIDDKTVLPGNKTVTGIEGLQQHLLSNERDRLADNMVRRLTAYAIGRSLTFKDQPELEKLNKQFAANDYRLSDLVTAIITSPFFLHQ
jgi:mono/diheme cytochrome c family protein